MAWMRSGGEWVFVGSDMNYADAIEGGFALSGDRRAGYGQLELNKALELTTIDLTSGNAQVTPAGLIPEDVWHMGAQAFRSGFYSAERAAVPKLAPLPGRLLFMRENGTIIASVGFELAGADMVKWLHSVTSIYKKGFKVRYLTQAVETHDLHPGAVADTFHDVGEVLEILDRWITGENYGGDGFDWYAVRDWAQFGLDVGQWFFGLED